VVDSNMHDSVHVVAIIVADTSGPDGVGRGPIN
jgi:hypothetical protein